MMAVFVVLAFPEWSMSCADCREWIHDDDGQMAMTKTQIPLPIRRPPGKDPPCHRCPKIPDSVPKLGPDGRQAPRLWEKAADITPEISGVWRFYRLCKTVGRFPADELVEAFAVMLADVENRVENRRRSLEGMRSDYMMRKLLMAARR